MPAGLVNRVMVMSHEGLGVAWGFILDFGPELINFSLGQAPSSA